jgi:hypothetical protein
MRAWRFFAALSAPRKQVMNMKIVFGGLLLAALSGSAMAQTTSYFVVQDVKTKKCTIVDKKPTDTTTTTVVGDGTVYTTRTQAEDSMKTVKVCTTQ